MAPDYSPETLADKMTAEQRVKQFVITNPAPVFEVAVVLIALLAAVLIAHYAEPIERFLAGLGI